MPLDLADRGDVRVLIEAEGAGRWVDVREAPEVTLGLWVRSGSEEVKPDELGLSPVQRMKDYVNELLRDPQVRRDMLASRKGVSKAQVHWARDQLLSLANGGATSEPPHALLALAFTKLEGLPERVADKKAVKPKATRKARG